MEDLAENALNIYTDGSGLHGPRIGGAGFLFIVADDDGEPEIHEESPPGWRGASNNQMELQALIEALKLATGRRPPIDPDRYSRIVVYTDSLYVADNFGRAVYQWSKNGWKKAGGAPVENTDQWRELMTLIRRIARTGKRIDVKKVKGHSKDKLNRRADKLARASAESQGATRRTFRPARIRRKLSPNTVDPGCVKMRGQTETIRIITDKALPSPHTGYSYMYEVVDEDSPDFQLVDKITSEIMLGAGHTYLVRLNDEQRNPRIEEMLSEVERDEREESDEPDAEPAPA